MCNCNQERAEYSKAETQSQKGVVKVKLMLDTPIEINGSITGRTYVFRKVNDSNWIDRRDVMSMNGIAGLQIFY
jgi:hypothetical protein